MQLTRSPRHKKLLIGLGLAFAVLVGVQLSSPTIQNRPREREIELPTEVKAIVEKSCYNCHSNQTDLKWFNRIAPISHLVAHDVTTARSRFNFSEWKKLTPAQQQVLLWEMVNAIEQQKMPLPRYLLAHPEAKVSPAALAVLKRYVNTLSGRRKVDTSKIISTVNLPLRTVQVANTPPVALTGIAYTADYKTWKVISATDKYDGGSMRIVYANDIMVKALESRQLPFPDGAKMVKAVWGKQVQDKEGNVFPGNFQNVQFMVKDSRKFQSTSNWGFAKFDGLTLKPFGKNAGFAKTCINCHRLLVSAQDFVFNIPDYKNLTKLESNVK
jgi:hypothetical protein